MPHRGRVVVVGSGPCGAIAARQLVSSGVDITLMDAGRKRPRGAVVRARGNTLVRFNSMSEMRVNRHIDGRPGRPEWYSSLAFGGLSNYWTGAVPRFDPRDFDEGASVDVRYRWPISYDDLAAWYDLAEECLTVTGSPTAVPQLPASATRFRTSIPKDWAPAIAAAARLGRGVAPAPMAKGRPWMVALRGTEFNSYDCVVEPLLVRPNFRLRSGAQVLRLVWSQHDERVIAVEYRDAQTGTILLEPCHSVVLAAGALDTTRILLSSTSPQFPMGLGNNHNVLGRYLHDHPKEWWQVGLGRPLTLPHHPIYVSRAAHTSSRPLSASSWTIGLADPRDRVKTWAGIKGRRLGVQIFGTMIPRDTTGVQLVADSTDDSGLPAIRIDLDYDRDVSQNMEQSRREFLDFLRSMGMAPEPPTSFPDLIPGSSVHFAGSARMHTDPRFGVVDGWNRVHGAANVIVADSSCFTTCSEKNPVVTAMAIAARAADQLGRTLGRHTTPSASS